MNVSFNFGGVDLVFFFPFPRGHQAWQVELLVSLSAFALKAGDAQGAKTKALEVSLRVGNSWEGCQS